MKERMIRRDKPTIFQQIAIPIVLTSLVVVIVLQVSDFFSQKDLISKELKSKFSNSLALVTDYFSATYAFPIQHDLRFIENSYAFNSFLSAQKEEILLAKPLAERLFLHFTNREKEIYLSLRFIDQEGVTKLETEGNRRKRGRVLLADAPKDALHNGISGLFSNLILKAPGTILCGNLFEYQGKWTFLVGITKSEPETGGTAGVAIFHCDLTDFFAYLERYEFFGERMVTVTSLNYEPIFPPFSKDAAACFGKDPIRTGKCRTFYDLSKEIKINPESQALFNVVFRASSKIFRDEMKDALIRSVLFACFAASFIGLMAWIISGNFSRPLLALFRALQQFSQGDLSARAHVKTTGEIQMLNEAFNKMAGDLDKTTVSRDALIKEINERKQAETALRESRQLLDGIMDAISVRVFWKDKDLVYLGCNAAFARDAGFANPKDVIGKDDHQMVWRGQAELYRGDDRQVIESGHPKLLIEEPQTTPQGDTLTLLTNKIPLRNFEGEIIGVLGTYMDITERKAVEKREKMHQRELEIFYKVSVNREERIVDLKKEIEQLRKKLGK